MNNRKRSVGFVVASLLSFGLVSNARADEPAPPEQPIHGANPDELAKFAALHEYEVTPEVQPLAPRVERVVSTAPLTRPRNRGLLYGGIGTGVAGVAMLVGGLMIKTEHEPASCRNLSALGEYVYGVDCAYVGVAGGLSNVGKYTLIGLGGSLIGGGITMGVIGGWEVPITPRAPKAEPTKAPRPQASIAIGPTSGSLRVSF